MQAMFNGKITVKSKLKDSEDDDYNQTYESKTLLTDEPCRAFDYVKNKLTDDGNKIEYKAKRFIIMDTTTDLNNAYSVEYNEDVYIVIQVIEPISFNRMFSRTIEAVLIEEKT